MREYAIFLTLNAELENLRHEEIRRQFQSTGPGLGTRVVSVLRSVRQAIAARTHGAQTLTPSLTD